MNLIVVDGGRASHIPQSRRNIQLINPTVVVQLINEILFLEKHLGVDGWSARGPQTPHHHVCSTLCSTLPYQFLANPFANPPLARDWHGMGKGLVEICGCRFISTLLV